MKTVFAFWLALLCSAPVLAQSTVMPKEPAQSDMNPDALVDGELSSEQNQDIPYEQLRRFARAYAMVKNKYVEPVDDTRLINAAIEGMVSDLDPHSTYLDHEDMLELQEYTDGEFGGLGIELGQENQVIKIIAPIEGTPAARAGVMPGDLLIKIDAQKVDGKSMSEVSKLLRGDAGTEVRLTLMRPSVHKELEFLIKRELIKIKSVRSKMIGDIAYVRISQFQVSTVGDLVTQLKAFGEMAPKGLVLDLRNDPGGLLNVAVGVVQAFAGSQDSVVSTKARDQVVEQISRYNPENLNFGVAPLRNLPKWTVSVPMVVLINVGSASASEVVAGALQDYKRATIMGTRSFGKGSVQLVFPIDEQTGIKLTIARYYTPNGRSIQATGITPDISVSDSATGNLFSFPREVDLKDHLNNDKSKVDESARKSTDVESSAESELKPFDFGSAEDFQLQQALNHLEGRPVNPGVLDHMASTVVDPVKIDNSPKRTEPSAINKEVLSTPEVQKLSAPVIEKSEPVTAPPAMTPPQKFKSDEPKDKPAPPAVKPQPTGSTYGLTYEAA